MASYSQKDIEHRPWTPQSPHPTDTHNEVDAFKTSGLHKEGHHSLSRRACCILRFRRIRAAWAPACLVFFLYIIYRGRLYNHYLLDITNSPHSAHVDTTIREAATPRLDHIDMPFPRSIWQTSPVGSGGLHKADAAAVSTWTKLNPTWRHELVTGTNADTLVSSAFSHDPHLVHTFHTLTDPILRADLIRYLVMFSSGGLYSDLDTLALKPIDYWIAPEHHAAKVVVGVEYDRRDDLRWINWTRNLQFTSWTMLAQPGHPLFALTVRKALIAIETLARRKNTHISVLRPTVDEVLDTTGPALFTDTIFDFLSERTCSNFTWLNVTKLENPLLVSDILILPVTSFGSGQRHSCAGSPSHPDALVRHLFRGSWKKGHGLISSKFRTDADIRRKTSKERPKSPASMSGAGSGSSSPLNGCLY